MNRLRQEAVREEMRQANKTGMEGGVKMNQPKWAGVSKMVKSQLQKAFYTEEELAEYLEANPQYVINQRFGFETKMINVDLYEHGYAVISRNKLGYRIPERWLSDEEVAQYLQDTKA